MTTPSIQTLYQVTEATWPPAATQACGPFTIRDGQGGGKRVSAATLEGDLAEADLGAAETAMRDLGQTPLFQVRLGEKALDEMLQSAGYEIIDPVNIYATPAATLATERPPVPVAIPAWEPLKIMEEMWAAGGIGPERIDVMRRGCAPKTGFISRWKDKPAGTSYVGMYEGITMLHALEIAPSHRRLGLAQWVMRQAAVWTLQNQGHTLAVICTQANNAANNLYSGLGMDVIGQYHYRIKPE